MGLHYLKDVTTIALDNQKCTGCGRCLEVCPHAVFVREEKKVRIDKRNSCIECGACKRNCAFGAISVDAGVGCAAALIAAKKAGKDASQAVCGCSDGGTCCG